MTRKTLESYQSSSKEHPTTPLIQELNLAQRACWHKLTKTSNITINNTNTTSVTIAATNQSKLIGSNKTISDSVSKSDAHRKNSPHSIENSKQITINRMIISDYVAGIAEPEPATFLNNVDNGAKFLGQVKRSYRQSNTNCDSVNNCVNNENCVKNINYNNSSEVNWRQLCYTFRFYATHLLPIISLVLLSSLNLLLSTINYCAQKLTSAMKLKGRVKNFSNSITCINSTKSLLSKNMYLLMLIGTILLCASSIEGRPNTSVDNSIEGSESSHQIASPDLAATYPGLSLTSVGHPGTQSKRAAEVSTTTSPDVVHDKQDVKRYPVAQVEFDRVKTPFIIGIWILSASIAKIGFHMTPKLNKIFPESCLLIVVGVIIGIVLFFATEVEVSPLTPNTFFFYMLPPIILDAGYFMPNRLFFDNLGTILLMAVVGTIFNIATIGASLWAFGLTEFYHIDLLDSFLFSSVVSAVDPVAVLAVFEEIHVNEILYIVVFGESLLNDAVTVVLYHMMEAYNEIGVDKIKLVDLCSGVASFFVVALGGTVIGVIWGFLTGLVTRFTDHVRVIEPIFIFVMAYLAYLNAEIFHMSGILAITFCGITMKNYVESNISQKSHTTVKYALKMLSSSSETIIFMFLGVATVNNRHVWNTWFVLMTILFCSVYRVLGVIILTALANRFRLHKLSRVDQFVMSYGGLRGAVAFALVLLIDESHVPLQPMFVTTTIAVVYFTVFLQGITIKPLVKFLNVKRASKRKPTMNERIHERFMDHLMAGVEDIVGKTGNYNVRDKFKRFDNRFIRPYLIRDLKGAEPKIIETYSKLTMRDAMEVMRRNPSTIGQMSGTESMSALFRNYTSNNFLGGSPSLTNLETCSRNLDMHELDYNPSKKDLTDAKIHHLLAEELKPYRRHRRLSYSRHAVDDRDLSTQVNYKMHMNIRRMVNDRKHHKRSKRGANKDNLKQNHVSFHDFQQNGSTKQLSHDYINEVLNESAEDNPKSSPSGGQANDDWDDGLTFTAKSSLGETAVIQEEERHLSRDSDGERRVATPTAIESQLPWKRTEDDGEDGGALQQNEFPAWASNKEYLAYNSPSATFLGGLSKPKQAKSVIGLFRRESSGSGSVIGSGGISGGGGDGIGSDPSLAAAAGQANPSGSMLPPSSGAAGRPAIDKRSMSISGVSPLDGSSSHSGPFPVTASHRRNTRRGSMLELSGNIIPEENQSIPEREKWNTGGRGGSGTSGESPLSGSGTNPGLSGSGGGSGGGGGINSGSGGRLIRGSVANTSGREPLLPKLTPKAQIRRMNPNQVTTALLSSSNSASDSDSSADDDEDEDVNVYDEDIIRPSSSSSRRDGNHGGERT